MSISDSAKVDLLYKKYFGVAKTDLPANKSPSNEAIASPLLVRGDTVWQQASSIPATAAAVAGIVQSYNSTSRVECAADNTTVPISSVYPTWKTGLTDWIPSEFGSSYFIKVYVDNTGASDPSSTGTQIFDSGSGGTGEWNFDYSAGVLNFIGGTIPAALTSSKKIFVMGYRYIGLKGVNNFGNLTIGNISITGNTITGNTGITFGGTITGNVIGNLTGTVLTPSQPYITTVGTLGNLTVTSNVSTGNLLVNGFFWGNGVPIVFSNYGNANVVTLLSSFGSNSISTTGNITGQLYGNVHADYIFGNSNNVVVISATGALLLPKGTEAQRPIISVAGEIRYNTDTLSLEWFNGTTWSSLTSSIGYQQFDGDGTTKTFALSYPADQNSMLVNINGTMQFPGYAYTVSGGNIIFSEAPQALDHIDIRFIAVPLVDVLGANVGNISISNYTPPQALGPGDSPTFQNITINGTINGGGISGGGGSTYSNANVKSYLTSFDGNIIPAANITYSLGDATHWWKDLYVGSNTIYIGGKPLTANIQNNTITYNNQIIGGTTYTKQSTAPSNPKVGDQWYDTDYDVLYEYIQDSTHSTWVDITGPFGVAGIQGNIGPQGPAGSNGTSVTIIGSASTYSSLPSWGNLTAGNGFILQDSGNLAVYDGSAFHDVGTIRGPKGDTGAQGIQGIQGNTGPQGANGINGSNYLNFGNITANANLNLVTGTLNFVSSNGVKVDINDPADTATIYLDSNGNINVYSVTSRFAENVITGNVPSSYTPDWSAGTIHNYTATQNFTLNAPVNMPVGGSMTIVVTQDSNGSRAMTANAYYKFASNIKTLSTGANSVDMMNFVRTGTNTYLTVLTKGYA
jgi:hypothetical protein